jgi:hypothetical protein
MKILHLTFHIGTANAIQSVLDLPGIDLTTKIVTSGDDGYFYNMTKERAYEAWEEHKDFYNTFDVIITSDTAPLSRIFLQNGFKGKVIVYICNRFDYGDTKDPKVFPDKEYYELMKWSATEKNVWIVANNIFESVYAMSKGTVVHTIINPVSKPYYNSSSKEGYYIPTYLNDSMLKLHFICLEKGIQVWTGRYKDKDALAHFKAVIHLPYTWNSIALWDALSCGVAYYVPTQGFLLELLKIKDYWFQDMHWCKENLGLCEFYREKNSKFIKYFNSFDDIRPIEINSEEVYQQAEELFNQNQQKWINILNS